MTQILIVEDEPDIAEVVAKYLLSEGFTTHLIGDGKAVVSWVRLHQPRLIVLDLMLPGLDGLTICRELRAFSQIPIIITTARVEEIDRLIGFESGADDYVCKPYSARELVARIKSLLRRAQPAVDNVAVPLLLLDKLKICYRGESVTLTVLEYRLFELFYKHPDRIYSRSQIQDRIYDEYRDNFDRTVDSHIRNLRRKLKTVGLDECIKTIYGAGYRYQPPEG